MSYAPLGRSPRTIVASTSHADARRPPLSAVLCGVLGATAAIVATFVPWVSSGRSYHNLYAAVGTSYRIGFLDYPWVPRLLPWIGLAFLIPIMLGVLCAPRIAAWLALGIAVISCALTIVVIVVVPSQTRAGVGLSLIGPMTMLTGTAAMTFAALIALVHARRATRSAILRRYPDPEQP